MHRGQLGMQHADLPQLILQLHELRKVRDHLRLARLGELHRREEETSGDGERRQRLERHLNDLQRGGLDQFVATLWCVGERVIAELEGGSWFGVRISDVYAN